MMANLQRCLDPLFCHQLKTLSKLDFLDLRMQLGIMSYVRSLLSWAKATTCYPTSTWPDIVDGFDLRHHAVIETSTLSLYLRLTILVDSFGPECLRY